MHQSDFEPKISRYAQLKIYLSFCHYVPRFFALMLMFGGCMVVAACGYYKMEVEKEDEWLVDQLRKMNDTTTKSMNPVFGNFVEYKSELIHLQAGFD